MHHLKPEKPKRRLSSDQLENTLLNEDYPQHAPLLIISRLRLMLGSRGKFTKDDFYNSIEPDKLRNLEEYITRWCHKNGEEPPSELSDSLKIKADIIRSLVDELRSAIRNRAKPKEIYGIAMRFQSEAGIPMKPISEFEN